MEVGDSVIIAETEHRNTDGARLSLPDAVVPYSEMPRMGTLPKTTGPSRTAPSPEMRLTHLASIPPWTKVMFLEDGQARVESAEFQEQISALIDCVIDRLEAGVTNSLARLEAFCDWDPYDLTDETLENLGDLLDEAVPVTQSGWTPIKDAANSSVSAVKLQSGRARSALARGL